uniref:Sema domain-containing protein n=1 Tax=Pygocentrus nattereri TaxID=42514 RepID=A0AAR2J0I6_PYGNA
MCPLNVCLCLCVCVCFLEFSTDMPINNVVQDPATGLLYLGAVNAIYQLDASLKLEARAVTGPKKDARSCTPPVSTCVTTELKDTNNINKLLLVHPTNRSLIVCGSVYRGICSLLNLNNVNEQIYYSDSKGERTYAASIDENVSVVGVMATFQLKDDPDKKPFDVFLIGKGYGGHEDNPKLITTRILENYKEWVVFESIVEASPVQAIPYPPLYQHQFRFAFKDTGFVYFLFSRTLGGAENFTFVSRLCEKDEGYYSYTELQLSCRKNGVQYNKVQAAYITEPGKELARAMQDSGQYGTVTVWDKVLFIVASRDGEDATDSALCMYPLKRINERVEDILNACYTENGKIGGQQAVYSPYKSITDNPCENRHSVSSTKNRCGAEFLRYPLASRPQFALQAEAIFTRKGHGHLTAVAIAVENDHTIAFLGNSLGEVVKVHLSGNSEVSIRVPGDTMGSRVNKNLFFDKTQSHLYITTEKKVTKVPVQLCHLKTDCMSCMAQKDPYCGWCVLEGRCTRRSECSRAEEKNGWLWSSRKECVKIVSFHPPNLSCKKSQQVNAQVSQTQLPHLFLNFPSQTIIRKAELADLLHLPSYCTLQPYGECRENFVAVPLKVLVNDSVEVASRNFEFYNCAAAIPHCIFAVNSPVKQHLKLCYVCHMFQAKNCPRFENPDPILIPVGHKTRISFEGVNLEAYKVITLYNCSLGREDCSLCKNADLKYQCVWCPQTRSCVFEKLCSTVELQECPDPGISAIIPRYGPLNGGISVTIKGSNLGIQKEDIKHITVAGVPCIQQEEKYSVSTRHIICLLYLSGRSQNSHIRYFIANNATAGQSYTTFFFTLSLISQDPKPLAVYPDKGPKEGGTLITITGNQLHTASKEDIAITVGGVEGFGEQITCKVGKYPSEKVPSDVLPVKVHYGKRTETQVSAGRGFSKAMTAKEAQAFLGDVSCNVNTLQDDKLFLDPPTTTPRSRSKRQRRDVTSELLDLLVGQHFTAWVVGSVRYERKYEVKLDKIIIPAVVVPMLLIIAISIVCYRRKSQQAEREYEKVKHQLENLEESVRDRCKKEFTDLMIEMEDHTNDLSEGRIPFLDYKTYTDRVFFLPSKDGANDVMITGKLDIPEARKATVAQALNQFSNLLNSKTFLITFIRTLEARSDFNARAKVYFASLLTVALHGKLEYYTDIMRTLLLGLMEEYVQSKNPKLMLRRSETVVERMLCNWMSICLYQFLKDSAGEPLYKLFRAIKHQIEKGPVDSQVKKAKYTLNDTGLLGDDVEYSMLVRVLVQGEGPDITPVKVLDCDTISQVKEKIIEQVYKNLPYSQRPKVESVTLEWRPGSTGQILSDLDVTSQKEGRWRHLNTLAHYNVRDNATLVLSRVLHTQQSYDQNHDNHEERNALLEDDKVFHLVRPADELDEMKSKRGSIKDKSMTKAITEIYLTRLLSVKGTLQQFVDDFFRSVLCSGTVVPPAVKYFFDFLDEQALKHENVDEETIHIWKTNSLPLRFWVNILKNPHFIFDVHVTEVVDASLSVIAQTFMDACTKSEHKLSRDSPSNKLLYAKEISTYKKMVDEYYKGIRQMVPVSDQDMNTHLAEVSRAHTDKLNTQVALHQLYQYASKYYKEIVLSLDEDPAAQSKQLTLRLQQIAAALENKVTDL